MGNASQRLSVVGPSRQSQSRGSDNRQLTTDDRIRIWYALERQLVGGENPSPDALNHDVWYPASSTGSAAFATRSGRNESIMTANSSVPFAPIDASARPGCGPCGIPSG